MFPAILSSLIFAAAFASARPAVADDTIKIGEINSYSAIPSFTEPYRKGWQLALDEINAAGGVDGKKLEVISKDDGGKPADAVTAANELVASDGVAMLAGTFFSNIGLAVSDYAKQKKILFLAAEPLTDAITLSKGNRYTFRLRPGTYEQAAMLADEAAKLPAKKWATIAPNYEYGQSAVAAFKKLLSAKRPDIVWVGEQWPPQGKIDAGAVAEAIAKTEPDAIFNVTFGADLVKLVREGETRGLFKDRAVVSVLAGEPEYLDPLKDETPEGWIVTGTLPSSRPIRPNSTTIPGLARWSATRCSKAPPRSSTRPSRPIARSSSTPPRASRSTRPLVRSLSAPMTINRRLALSSARPRSRTAKA